MWKVNPPILVAFCMFMMALAVAVPAAADIHYVSPGQSIQAAINDADDGDEIEVASGTYNEAINFNGKAVRLYSIDGPEVTTIDASGLETSVVACINSEDANTVLEGFTITGGYSTYGGGMYNLESNSTVINCTFTGNTSAGGGGMYNSVSSPTVTDCTFSGNSAISYGGGMYNNNSSPTVINCTFSGNSSASDSGGMYNLDSSPTVTNCTFSGNSAGWNGGGMHNQNQTINNTTVTNCTFIGNTATNNGGGMYNSVSSPTMTNCTFRGNTATNNGGGMYNFSGSQTLTNCTFSGNSATTYGGGMYNEISSSTVTNCILWGNSPDEIYNNSSSPTVTYCDVQGGYGEGEGNNIDADPCFLDAASGDFHLLYGSPCIDAGTNSAPSLPATDFEGDTRIINGSVDMGVDEYVCDPAILPSPADGASMVSVDVQLSWTAGVGAVSHDVWFGTDNPPVALIADDITETNTDPGPLEYGVTYYWQVDENTSEGTVTGDVWSFRTEIWDIWVDDDYWDGGENDGHTWGIDAFANIGAGIDMAEYGTTVHVAAGSYVENITLKNGVALIGSGGDVTIIDANASGSAVISTGCDANTILNGFKLTNGNATNGGGMYNENGSPVITKCIFFGNFSATGGGIYNNSSDSRISHCVFQENLTKDGADGGGNQDGGKGGNGAGMCNNHSSVFVTDCFFLNNLCGKGGNGGIASPAPNGGDGGNGGSGGGMYNYYCSPIVTSCYFKHNRNGNGGNGGSGGVTGYGEGGNGGSGGAIVNNRSSAIVTHCVFYANSSGSGGAGGNGGDAETDENGSDGGLGGNGGAGGAVYNYTCWPTFANCMFFGNSTGLGGNGGHGGFDSCVMPGGDGGDAGNGGSGGSIYNSNSPSLIMNCTFAANKTGSGGVGGHPGDADHSDGNPGIGGLGGGISNTNNSNLIVTNSILWSNNASGSGDEVYNSSSEPNFSYSDIAGSGGSGAGWDGSLGTDEGGNIDADPLFAGDFHLMSEFGRAATDPSLPFGTWSVDTVTSPCIDAGDPNMDVGNEPEGNGGRINMGYYGGTYQASKSSYVGTIEGDVDGDGDVDFKDLAILCGNWLAGTEPEL